MNMIDKPKVGQVWERDGLQREVISTFCCHTSSLVEDDYFIYWVRPGREAEFGSWLPNWNKWKQEAHLVKEADHEKTNKLEEEIMDFIQAKMTEGVDPLVLAGKLSSSSVMFMATIIGSEAEAINAIRAGLDMHEKSLHGILQ